MAAYTRTTWQDRAVERPRTYTVTDNGDGSKTFTPAPGTVTQQGTPVNALNLNNIEAELVALDTIKEGGAPMVNVGGTSYTLRVGTEGAAGYLTFVLEE